MAFITRLCKKFNLLLAIAFLALSVGSAYAEDIGIVHAKGMITKEGRMSVGTRFRVTLPNQLSNALLQGVTLNFKLSYSLDAPTYSAYKYKVGNWFSDSNSLNYKLSYHPLNKRYKVSLGGFSTDYTTLAAALNSIGGISNWQLLPKKTLSGLSPRDVQASIRLSLTMDDLPKPFQINVITSKKWRLDTDWVYLAISEEN